jgi:hypothetical protein
VGGNHTGFDAAIQDRIGVRATFSSCHEAGLKPQLIAHNKPNARFL